MKKYITLIVCAVLLLVSVLVYAPPIQDVNAGSGFGVNAKITTKNQMVDVAEFAYNNYPGSTANYGYTSGTVEISYRASGSSNSYYDGWSYESRTETSQEIVQKVFLATTKEALYYHITGKEMVVYDYSTRDDDASYWEEQSVKMTINYDFEVYQNDDLTYIRYNTYDVIGSDNVEDEDEQIVQQQKELITADMLGKWFGFSSDSDSSFYTDYSIRSKYLSPFTSRLNSAPVDDVVGFIDVQESSAFQKVGSVYTLSPSKQHELVEDCVGEVNSSRSFLRFDLSNSNKPVLEFNLTASQSDDEYSSDITYATTAMMYNINNTTINCGIETGRVVAYNIKDFIVEE